MGYISVSPGQCPACRIDILGLCISPEPESQSHVRWGRLHCLSSASDLWVLAPYVGNIIGQSIYQFRCAVCRDHWPTAALFLTERFY
eukprot:scaffold25738_cov18-Prasinocladus_malaysianus.AAC.2